ncbi:MAG: hypothetical protein SX243_24050 [Acidobacteriota bacterium]|nr:hypothetical protein [Acidobacteriota bacterium]
MPTLVPSAELFRHISELVARPAHWRALLRPTEGQGDDPQHLVEEFIGRLRRLEGIPFPYLVPDNAMLPPESIRFFTLDQNWVDALCDGALSLGRLTDMDQQHDAAVGPVLVRRSEHPMINHRRRRLRRPAQAVPEAETNYSGFLLRSALVSGWPGLEVRATAAASGSGPNTQCSGAEVELIRMSRLSPDVLLCLFAGPFGCVQIHEPKEGITYGAILSLGEDADGAPTAQLQADSYSKQLRGLGIGGYTVGEFIDGAEVPVPLRSASTRVVEINQLRKSMVSKLKGLSPPAWEGSEEAFTSAHFALQMVEGASQHIFRATDSSEAASEASSKADTGQPARRKPVAEQLAEDRAALNRFLFDSREEDPS